MDKILDVPAQNSKKQQSSGEYFISAIRPKTNNESIR